MEFDNRATKNFFPKENLTYSFENDKSVHELYHIEHEKKKTERNTCLEGKEEEKSFCKTLQFSEKRRTKKIGLKNWLNFTFITS